MAQEAKLSSKNQIVIPKELRTYAHLKEGDKLLIDGQGGRLVLVKAPQEYTRHMEGLHQEVWKNVSIDNYIKSERKTWPKRNK